MKSPFLSGCKASLPTILGYLSIGFAAGVVEKTAGMSILEVVLMSTLVYAGSAQFIAAGMLGAGSSSSTIVLTILFVNLRHLLMSAALSPKLRKFGLLQNILLGSLLTDESFGVASGYLQSRDLEHPNWFHGLNVAAYVNWIIANIIGAWLGGQVSNPQALGLQFALPAMFAGLLVLQLEAQSDSHIATIVIFTAVILTIVLSALVPGNWTSILAIVFTALIGMGVESWKSTRASSPSS